MFYREVVVLLEVVVTLKRTRAYGRILRMEMTLTGRELMVLLILLQLAPTLMSHLSRPLVPTCTLRLLARERLEIERGKTFVTISTSL